MAFGRCRLGPTMVLALVGVACAPTELGVDIVTGSDLVVVESVDSEALRSRLDVQPAATSPAVDVVEDGSQMLLVVWGNTCPPTVEIDAQEEASVIRLDMAVHLPERGCGDSLVPWFIGVDSPTGSMFRIGHVTGVGAQPDAVDWILDCRADQTVFSEFTSVDPSTRGAGTPLLAAERALARWLGTAGELRMRETVGTALVDGREIARTEVVPQPAGGWGPQVIQYCR